MRVSVSLYFEMTRADDVHSTPISRIPQFVQGSLQTWEAASEDPHRAGVPWFGFWLCFQCELLPACSWDKASDSSRDRLYHPHRRQNFSCSCLVSALAITGIWEVNQLMEDLTITVSFKEIEIYGEFFDPSVAAGGSSSWAGSSRKARAV